MRHIVFADADKHPIALVIKSNAFNRQEIRNTYVLPLLDAGIPESDVVAVTASYNEAGKAPVRYIKENLDTLLPALQSVGTEYIYCADAAYFKVLTNSKKAEPHLGYALQCAIKGYEHMQVILGVNHKSLIYNPANEPKLTMSLDRLISAVQGTHEDIGADIIHSAIYPTTDEFIRLELQELHQYPTLSCDIEAFSLIFHKAGVATITFCWDQHNGIAFPVDYVPNENGLDKGLYGQQVHNAKRKEMLRQFFETYEGEIRWHGSTYDLGVLIYELWMVHLKDTPGLLKGLEVMTKNFHDTKIIAYLATNTTAGNSLKLKDLAHEFAGNWAQDDDDIKDVRKIPLHDLLQYNLVDGLATNYVFDKYYPIMVQDQQLQIYEEIFRESILPVLQSQLTGMPLNPVRVQEVKEILTQARNRAYEVLLNDTTYIPQVEYYFQHKAMEAANAKLKTKQHPLSKFADLVFNPNSDQQKQYLFYEVMGLPIIDLTKNKQPSVGARTIKKLLHRVTDDNQKEILETLIDFAEADKILTTYITAFERAEVDEGGVAWLYGNFNLGGTKSGRMSSSNPNLQNIPSGSTYGKLIKSCFQAPAGYLFGGADFNSLEDYVSALTTKDPNKLKVYLDGYDGHCLRAYSYFPERLPGIVNTVESINSIKDKFPDIRQLSKAPTFLLTYGGTASGLTNNLGFPEDVAKQIEANYHDLYRVSDEWVQARLDQAAIDGYVTVAFGLRLRTPLLAQTLRNHKSTPYEAAAEGRTAGNALGQSYGLLTNRSMNAFMRKVWASPYRYDIWPVAMIHDANYFVFRDDIEVVKWINDNLIDEMRWQELPELQHDTVKLGAALSIFWPAWDNELTLPNYATHEEIKALCVDFHNQYSSKQEESA